METLDCIRERASVRSFKKEPVPGEVMHRILEAGIQAPSAGNSQDWEFIVVKKPELKSQLTEAAFGQKVVSGAPVVVVVCSSLDRIERSYGERGVSLYSVQDTAAAVQNMLLAAWDQGIGSCWVGAFNERAVKDALVLPERVRPVALIPFGYPAEKPVKSGRLDLDRVVHEEMY
jgi:nitroreductase